MAALEKIPTLKEIKEKGALKVLGERFPAVKRIGGGGSKGLLGGNPQLPTLEEIKEKGVLGVLGEKFPAIGDIKTKGTLSVLEERFPKIKEARTRGILGIVRKGEEGVTEEAGEEIHERPRAKEYVKPAEESRII